MPIKDLVRLGRRRDPLDSSTSRPRPVLLKLLSSWDRRLVLSAVRELKGFSVKGIYIHEDLS